MRATGGLSLAAVLVVLAAPGLSAQKPVLTLPPAAGMSIVMTLTMRIGDRESVHTVAEASPKGLRWTWNFIEIHTTGDTLRESYRYMEADADIKEAQRLWAFHDTTAGEHPGYSMHAFSRAVYRRLRAAGSDSFQIMTLESPDGSGMLASLGIMGSKATPVRWRGTLALATPAPVPFPLLLNGQRVNVPALHLRGQFSWRQKKWTPELWILADSMYPMLLKWTGSHAETENVLQTIRVDLPGEPLGCNVGRREPARQGVQGGAPGHLLRLQQCRARYRVEPGDRVRCRGARTPSRLVGHPRRSHGQHRIGDREPHLVGAARRRGQGPAGGDPPYRPGTPPRFGVRQHATTRSQHHHRGPRPQPAGRAGPRMHREQDMILIPSLVAMAFAAFCPTAAEVTESVGFPVKVFPQGTRAYGQAEMCAYQGASSANTMISISVQPYDANEDPNVDLRASAKRLSGAEAERIAIGDGGYAYGSKSKSEAAARKGSRVYHAEIMGAPEKKDAAIALAQAGGQMRRGRRKVSLLSTFYFVVTLGVLVGGSVWLDDKGETVAARVTGKVEEVHVGEAPQGHWDRFYRVGVEFPTANDGLGQATVTVPVEKFDALRYGDTLRVRYLPAFPLLARTPDRSTVTVLLESGSRLGADPFLLPFVIWLAGGAVMFWVAVRVATAAVFAAGFAWVAVAFIMVFPESEPVTLGPSEAVARVHDFKLVTKSPSVRGNSRRRAFRSTGDGVRRLAVPYVVARLRFPVPGRPDTVLVVDAIDSASAAGITTGAELPVRYDPVAPRDARLAIGSRTFTERNRYHLRVPLVGLGLLCTLGAWGWRSRRTRGERVSNSSQSDRREPMSSTVGAMIFIGGMIAATAGEVSAQGSRPVNPACALLTVDEVRRVTGEPAYDGPSPGENDTERAGGTASCRYGGRSVTGGKHTAMISITVIPKGIKAAEAQRKQPLKPGCKREDVTGLGDDALYEACEKGPGAVIVSRQGTADLLVQIEAKPGTDPGAKATVVALTRAALARVK